uniref:Uncharacterized protein n=1 Tax=Arundo donax TaxID=35708 RepID=A0A0A8YHN1_ARUDO
MRRRLGASCRARAPPSLQLRAELTIQLHNKLGLITAVLTDSQQPASSIFSVEPTCLPRQVLFCRSGSRRRTCTHS